MKSHYASTIVGMLLALAAVAVAAIFANSAAADANSRYSRQSQEARAQAATRKAHRQTLLALEQAMQPARKFSSAWHLAGNNPGKQVAEVIRTDVEMIAQRQLGLVTDGAITPPPERYTFGGASVPVQRVTLRASGNDLAGLLTWLGAVEEKYPLAIIELCEFSSNVGGNTGLTIRLAQPLQEISAIRAPSFRGDEDIRAQPAMVAATPWSDYSPVILKGSVPVGFHRNPLQPAIAPDLMEAVLPRANERAVAAKLESAVSGRLHSVVRGPIPIINIDGKLFRVGDEITIGPGREKPVIDAKTKLKQIERQQLVFHVSGGTSDKPIECDVAYRLPTFFQAR